MGTGLGHKRAAPGLRLCAAGARTRDRHVALRDCALPGSPAFLPVTYSAPSPCSAGRPKAAVVLRVFIRMWLVLQSARQPDSGRLVMHASLCLMCTRVLLISSTDHLHIVASSVACPPCKQVGVLASTTVTAIAPYMQHLLIAVQRRSSASNAQRHALRTVVYLHVPLSYLAGSQTRAMCERSGGRGCGGPRGTPVRPRLGRLHARAGRPSRGRVGDWVVAHLRVAPGYGGGQRAGPNPGS